MNPLWLFPIILLSFYAGMIFMDRFVKRNTDTLQYGSADKILERYGYRLVRMGDRNAGKEGTD